MDYPCQGRSFKYRSQNRGFAPNPSGESLRTKALAAEAKKPGRGNNLSTLIDPIASRAKAERDSPLRE